MKKFFLSVCLTACVTPTVFAAVDCIVAAQGVPALVEGTVKTVNGAHVLAFDPPVCVVNAMDDNTSVLTKYNGVKEIQITRSMANPSLNLADYEGKRILIRGLVAPGTHGVNVRQFTIESDQIGAAAGVPAKQ